MVEFELIDIIQIDATVITGILILLTIGRIRQSWGKFEEIWIPRSVALVVTPFSFSAILAILDSIAGGLFGDLRGFYYASLVLMTIGFVYVMVVVLLLTKKSYQSRS